MPIRDMTIFFAVFSGALVVAIVASVTLRRDMDFALVLSRIQEVTEVCTLMRDIADKTTVSNRMPCADAAYLRVYEADYLDHIIQRSARVSVAYYAPESGELMNGSFDKVSYGPQPAYVVGDTLEIKAHRLIAGHIRLKNAPPKEAPPKEAPLD